MFPAAYLALSDAVAAALLSVKLARIGQRTPEAVTAALLEEVPAFLPTTAAAPRGGAGGRAGAQPSTQSTCCAGAAFAALVARHALRWLESSGSCEFPPGLSALASAWARFQNYCGEPPAPTAIGRLLLGTPAVRALESAADDLEGLFASRVVGVSSGNVPLRHLRALRKPGALQAFIDVLQAWGVEGVAEFVATPGVRPAAPSPQFEASLLQAEAKLRAALELYSVAHFLNDHRLAPPALANEVIAFPTAPAAAEAAVEQSSVTELDRIIERFAFALNRMDPRAIVALRVFASVPRSARFCAQFVDLVARRRRERDEDAPPIPDLFRLAGGIALQEAERLRVR